MQEQIKMQEQEDITAMSQTDDSEVEKPIENEPDNEVEEKDEKTSFTQDQVNEIVKNRLEKERKKMLKRYGVEDKEQFDSLMKKANSYEAMDERYSKMLDTNKELEEKIAFLENQIDVERYDDVKAYFKGKELFLNSENLSKEVDKHPEWVKANKASIIKTMGSDSTISKEKPNEKDETAKLFGFNKFVS
jgi:hypothetical protein